MRLRLHLNALTAALAWPGLGLTQEDLIEHLPSQGLEIVPSPAKAGDVLFFSSYLLHASFLNTNDQPRWALISSYRDSVTEDTCKVGA
jgi:ectoine hydroxylase-related dioxygenase (phytanoyl-CoA dioxygenase family)